MIVCTLVLYYMIFQLKGKTSLKLPTNGVIHRTRHQSSPTLHVHALQVNLIKKLSFEFFELRAKLDHHN